MKIPFFRYSELMSPHQEEILRRVSEVMERGAFILQKELEQFENEVALFAGSRHAIGVADGTESMILALLAAGLDITTAFTAVGASLNNLGPGLGEVAVTVTSVPTAGKWILCLGMLLGRLEVFTLLVLFSPHFWRR